MTVGFERVAPGRLDPELMWGGVLAGAGMVAAGWMMAGLPVPVCLFRGVTGMPCLTCGGTRGVRELLAGDVGGALGWNPLVALGVLALGIFLVYAAVVTVFRLPRIRVRNVSSGVAWGIRAAIVAVAAGNWIYLIARFSE